MEQDEVECDIKSNDVSESQNLTEREECSYELDSDYEGGDVKKLCVAGAHNISKREMEVNRRVVTRGDVEMEGKASCSNMKSSLKVVKASVDGGNALNEKVLRVDAESVREGVDGGILVRKCKDKMRKMTLSELEDFLLDKVRAALALEDKQSDVHRRQARLKREVKHWQKRSTSLQRQIDEMKFVVSRYNTEKESGKKDAVPIKVTSSFGVQVDPSSFTTSVTDNPYDVECSTNVVPAADRVKEEVPKGIFPTPSTSGTTPAKRSVNVGLREVRDPSLPKLPPGVRLYHISSLPTTPNLPQAKPLFPPTSSDFPTISSIELLKPLVPPPKVSNAHSEPADIEIIQITDEGGEGKQGMKQAASATSKTILSSSSRNASRIIIRPASHVSDNARKVVGVSNTTSTSSTPVETSAAVTERPVRFVESSGASNLSPSGQNNPGAEVGYLSKTSSVPRQPVQEVHEIEEVQKMTAAQQMALIRQLVERHQRSKFQEGQRGQGNITSAPPVRSAVFTSSSKSPSHPAPYLKDDGPLVPLTEVGDNAHGLLKGPDNTFLHMGASCPSQQMGLGTSVQRMPSGSTPSAGARGPAAVLLAAPATSTAFGATIATRAAPSAVVAARPQAVAFHPAPLPPTPRAPFNVSNKLLPPEPHIEVSRNEQGVMVSWKMNVTTDCEEIVSYQLYVYQETTSPPSTTLWMKVGDVKSELLPMGCTLSQLVDGRKYYFAVRAVDIKGRCGPFSKMCAFHYP